MIKPVVGIVNANSFSGQTLLDLIDDSNWAFNTNDVRPFATGASRGRRVSCGPRSIQCEDASYERMAQCSAVIFCHDSYFAANMAPQLSAQKVFSVDTTGAFLHDHTVPLFGGASLKELNPNASPKLHAIASDTSCILFQIQQTLQDLCALKDISVVVLKGVSGFGKSAIELLQNETHNFFAAGDLQSKASTLFPSSIAFNLFPAVEKTDQISLQESLEETIHKEWIRLAPSLIPQITQVQTPIFVGESYVITLLLESEIEAEHLFSRFATGCNILDLATNQEANDDTKENEALPHYVTARDISGQSGIFITSLPRQKGRSNTVTLWATTDQQRNGTALNALKLVDWFCKNGTIE